MNIAKSASDYTIGELMAVSIARQMKEHDGDWVAVGAYSQLPAAGIKLARILYSPNLWWLAGGGGAINSSSKLQTSTSDHRVIRCSEYVMDMEDIVDIEMWRHMRRKEKIVAVIGGIQIDRRGSSNMVCVGEYNSPKVRGVGTVGLCFGVSFGILYFFTMHHNSKIFVDEVDFISSPGYTADRSKYVPPPCMPPRRVFSPLGIFDFEQESGFMRILSLHPGVSVAQVQAATGFQVLVPSTVVETAPPSAIEIDVLRNRVDPDGLLRNLRITH